MGQVAARVLKGFRDYLPEAEIGRQRMLREIVTVFESFGFSPLTTPALEYTEVLLGKYGVGTDEWQTGAMLGELLGWPHTFAVSTLDLGDGQFRGRPGGGTGAVAGIQASERRAGQAPTDHEFEQR